MSGMNQMVSLLVRIANDPAEGDSVRVAAVEGLGYVESQPGRVEARNALMDILEAPKMPLVRAAAARALGRLS